MKVKSLHLKNFKRFTNLSLQDIPVDTKLVLCIGSNGSGKSSVFDAFALISDYIHKRDQSPLGEQPFLKNKNLAYYNKWPNQFEINIEFFEGLKLGFQLNSINSGGLNYNKDVPANIFYGRSAVRYLPKITRTSIGQSIDIIKDADRPEYFIDADIRFENDIDLLIKDVVENVFKSINSDNRLTLLEVRVFLDKINDAFPRIFGSGDSTKLIFKSFVPPASGNPSRLIFQKGKSELDYDLLSAGEKEIVNLLFNLFVRNKVYTNTIYFMDEVDTHLNTRLQAALLKEITENWIPENCQLWTASHSLGFIQYAKESDTAVIFDFDDYNFDDPKILLPEPKDNPNLYNIAVDRDFLPKLFEHFNIVFVENKDAIYYGSIGIKNTVFVPENGRNGVYHKVKRGDFKGIVDRDFLTDDDISIIEQQYTTLKVIRYYSIENYLYHPENLEEHYSLKGKPFDKAIYIGKLTKEKNRIKDSLLLSLSLKRTEYPYFKEPDFNGKSSQKRFKNEKENFEASSILASYLNSDQFEDYYKILPMKLYATDLEERQQLSKSELAKTKWFSQAIEKLIKN